MEVKLKSVRLAFPALFAPRAFGDSEPRYSATLLIEKGSENAKAIEAAISAVAKEKWGEKTAAVLKSLKLDNKVCLQDGERKAQYEGFDGNLFVSASNDVRPSVFNVDGSPALPEDGTIYAGCYVNAIIDIWAQDNQYGKRINAKLLGVRKKKDGDPFSAGRSTASADDFDFDEYDEEDEVVL